MKLGKISQKDENLYDIMEPKLNGFSRLIIKKSLYYSILKITCKCFKEGIIIILLLFKKAISKHSISYFFIVNFSNSL